MKPPLLWKKKGIPSAAGPDDIGAAVAATRHHIVLPFHLDPPGWQGWRGWRRWRRRRFWWQRGRRRRGEPADAPPRRGARARAFTAVDVEVGVVPGGELAAWRIGRACAT